MPQIRRYCTHRVVALALLAGFTGPGLAVFVAGCSLYQSSDREYFDAEGAYHPPSNRSAGGSAASQQPLALEADDDVDSNIGSDNSNSSSNNSNATSRPLCWLFSDVRALVSEGLDLDHTPTARSVIHHGDSVQASFARRVPGGERAVVCRFSFEFENRERFAQNLASIHVRAETLLEKLSERLR